MTDSLITTHPTQLDVTVSVQGFPGIPKSVNIIASGVFTWLKTVAAMPARVIHN